MNQNFIHRFRAKPKRGSRKVYGDFVFDEELNVAYIVNIKYSKETGDQKPESFVEVYPETVEMSTGMLDNNGKMIYEGDILRYYDIEACYIEDLYSEYEEETPINCVKREGVVVFHDAMFGIRYLDSKNTEGFNEPLGYSALNLDSEDNILINRCVNLTEEEKKHGKYYGYEIIRRSK